MAWDDEQNSYMADLVKALKNDEIELTEVSSASSFTQQLKKGGWSFVVVDLWDERGQKPKETGIDLAMQADVENRSLPVFVVTAHVGALTPNIFSRLPLSASLRYKTDPAWMALLIRDELKLRGRYTDPARTFLIAGPSNDYRDHRNRIAKRLRDRKQQIIEAGKDGIAAGDLPKLREAMGECGTIIAVCTPDSDWIGGTKYPHHDVIAQIGLALGSAGGPTRLLILRSSGTELPDVFDSATCEEYEDAGDGCNKLDSWLSRTGRVTNP